MTIDRCADYPPHSLGAELQRIWNDADEALPGSGDLLMAKWNAWWTGVQEGGLRTAWDATA